VRTLKSDQCDYEGEKGKGFRHDIERQGSEFGASRKPHSASRKDASGNHTLNNDDIRRRAYEIYLERDGLAGRELEDWLQAEGELKSAALFMRATAGEKHRP